MKQLPSGLRIVTIESPYDHWNQAQVQQLFCKTLQVRLAGYGAEYGAGVFPVDGADFIGPHYIVCRENGSELIPLTGFRSTPWSMSRRHGLPFGGMGLVRSAGAAPHAAALEKVLAHCEAQTLPIAYIASWTMDPALRGDRELVSLLRELFMAISVLSHAETGTRIIGGCTIRFKVDRWFTRWGFEPLTALDGSSLDPVHVPFLLGEPVRMMYLKRFSGEILREAEPWRAAWENRLILDRDQAVPDRGAGRKAA